MLVAIALKSSSETGVLSAFGDFGRHCRASATGRQSPSAGYVEPALSRHLRYQADSFHGCQDCILRRVMLVLLLEIVIASEPA
jgi:hypothetical protein